MSGRHIPHGIFTKAYHTVCMAPLVARTVISNMDSGKVVESTEHSNSTFNCAMQNITWVSPHNRQKS